MAIHKAHTGASTFEFEGQEYGSLHIIEGNFAAAESVTGVALSRTIQGGVKVRPTNVTAVAYLVTFTAGSTTTNHEVEDIVEFILIQNGPKGGFIQLGGLGELTTQNPDIVGTGGSTVLFVNEVVDALITNV